MIVRAVASSAVPKLMMSAKITSHLERRESFVSECVEVIDTTPKQTDLTAPSGFQEVSEAVSEAA
jgi:hypothetical protein